MSTETSKDNFYHVRSDSVIVPTANLIVLQP